MYGIQHLMRVLVTALLLAGSGSALTTKTTVSVPAVLNATKRNEIDSKLVQNFGTLQKSALKLTYGDSMANKSFLGLDAGAVMGVFGPLALAAMVSLPFMAPAAAALLPLAGLSSVFGRRRRHLLDLEENMNTDPRIRRREKFGPHNGGGFENVFQESAGKLEKEKAKAKRYLERQIIKFLKRLNVAFENAERKSEFKR